MKFIDYINLILENSTQLSEDSTPKQLKGIIPQKDLERILGGRKIGDAVKSFPIGNFGIMTRLDNPGLWVLKPVDSKE